MCRNKHKKHGVCVRMCVSVNVYARKGTRGYRQQQQQQLVGSSDIEVKADGGHKKHQGEDQGK
jgi:hypothetical protein